MSHADIQATVEHEERTRSRARLNDADSAGRAGLVPYVSADALPDDTRSNQTPDVYIASIKLNPGQATAVVAVRPVAVLSEAWHDRAVLAFGDRVKPIDYSVGETWVQIRPKCTD